MRKREEDAYWDEMLERLDMDVSAMAEAERKLQEVGEERLEAEQVEAIVEAASARSQIQVLRVLPTRRLSVAAAVLIAFLMTTGLTAITVAVIHLLWSEGTNSNETMGYALAIQVLAHPNQPENPDKMAAMNTAWSRVNFGIDVLKRIRDDASSSAPLVDSAIFNLTRLRGLIDARNDEHPTPVDETLDVSATRAQDPSLRVDERLDLVAHIARLTASGIIGIRDVVNPTPDVVIARQGTLQHIRAVIDR